MDYVSSQHRKAMWARKQAQERLRKAHEAAQEREPIEYLDDSPPGFFRQCATQPRQEGDEYVCSKCGVRWDTREERPPCPKG